MLQYVVLQCVMLQCVVVCCSVHWMGSPALPFYPLSIYALRFYTPLIYAYPCRQDGCRIYELIYLYTRVINV